MWTREFAHASVYIDISNRSLSRIDWRPPSPLQSSDEEAVTAAPLDLTLNLVPQTQYPHAKCMDGTSPGYYFRPGRGDRAKSIIVFLEGGGWCYPSDVQQPCSPASSHCTANCHIRANSSHGSSSTYAATISAGAIEGGTGYTSGNATRTKFSDFGIAYARYCDGGSFSGTMTTPDIALNGTPPLYYAGKHNLDGVLGDLVASHGVGGYREVILSGCSAGGMACFIHCDYVADWFKKENASIDVRCICDAGVFLDVPTVTGAGDVMRQRFYDLADRMQTKPSLSADCVAKEDNWRECMFSATALKYTKTPLFSMNSMYNFAEWEMLAPKTDQSFPPDTTAPPADWAACWPGTGGLTLKSYATCNTTQRAIIAAHLATFKKALAPATSRGTPHGAWLSSCPGMHCQAGFATTVLVNGTSVGDAAARWYFEREVVKLVDEDFPNNKGCPAAQRGSD